MGQNFDIMVSSETNEWYTPPWIINLARSHMGQITCDPASNKIAQQWIQAREYYTEKDDGLSKLWTGNVWLNPPYGKTNGKSNAEIWAEQLARYYEHQYVTQGYLLVSSKFGYKWFGSLLRRYPSVTLWDRVKFINERGEEGGQSKVATTLFYFGWQHDAFEAIWKDKGLVIFP